ncbi:glycosyltransferase family 2 protein [Micrococcus luteus]|uniref:glycosyltransferase family 2 protein n=1 Tax=Micrococcus luteus TaxID=1270 RepID=UPI0010AE4E1B|nr:glycosyltransferase [Micrococcus luteus]TKD54574.1 glycosyltransferase [Micrococcus luteus]
MNPRISFVIRTFNDDPAHLRQAIASAAARSALPEETIVVDDESTQADLLEFPGTTEKAIQVIHQPNGGSSSAWNAGITRAATGYVFILGAMTGWSLSFVVKDAHFLPRGGLPPAEGDARSPP